MLLAEKLIGAAMTNYTDNELIHIAYLAQHESRSKLRKYLDDKLSKINMLEEMRVYLIEQVRQQVLLFPKVRVRNYCFRFIRREQLDEVFQEWMLGALQAASEGLAYIDCVKKGYTALNKWVKEDKLHSANQYIEEYEELGDY